MKLFQPIPSGDFQPAFVVAHEFSCRIFISQRRTNGHHGNSEVIWTGLGVRLQILASLFSFLIISQSVAETRPNICVDALSVTDLHLKTTRDWMTLYFELYNRRLDFQKRHPESNSILFPTGPIFQTQIFQNIQRLERVQRHLWRSRDRTRLKSWVQQLLDYARNLLPSVPYAKLIILSWQTSNLYDALAHGISDVDFINLQRQLTYDSMDFGYWSSSKHEPFSSWSNEVLWSESSKAFILPTFKKLKEQDFLPGWGVPMYFAEIPRHSRRTPYSRQFFLHDIESHAYAMYKSYKNQLELAYRMGIARPVGPHEQLSFDNFPLVRENQMLQELLDRIQNFWPPWDRSIMIAALFNLEHEGPSAPLIELLGVQTHEPISLNYPFLLPELIDWKLRRLNRWLNGTLDNLRKKFLSDSTGYSR